MYMSLRGFYSTYQSNSSRCDKYFETVNNLRDIISHCGGVIENHPFLVDKLLKVADPADPDDRTDDEKAEAKNSIKEARMATAFILGLNRGIYGVLLNDLHRIVPAQDGMFALKLWYVAKSIFRS